MAATNKSYSSFDTNDFIDLDAALGEEELRSLGSTPEHVHRHYSTSESPFRFSLKSIDEKEIERFRRSLVTPLSRYNTPEWRTRSRSPTGSYAESVALFKNLSNNNDHLDFVSSDFNEFMNSYDDDLLSRQENTSEQDVYHQRQSSSPFLHKLSQNKSSKERLLNLRYTDQLPDSYPRKNSMDASVQPKTKKSIPALAQRTTETSSRLQKDMERLVISKRQSVDSDAMRKLKDQQHKKDDTKLKRHSTLVTASRPRLTDTSTKLQSNNNIKLNNVPQKSIINTQQQQQQQPDRRRWSNYLPEDTEPKKTRPHLTNKTNLDTETTTRSSAFARRRHTLSNKEEPTFKTRHVEEKQRYHSDSLPSRHYTTETNSKLRRREVLPPPVVVVYDNEEGQQQPRRHRTLSNPTKQERYRKLSNNSKHPEKEVRFHPEEIVASHSSGLLSSSTTSSSHSGDLFYDPPSPPNNNTSQMNNHTKMALLVQKRRSVPAMDTQVIDEQVRATEHIYSQYLSRRPSYLEEESEESEQYVPRRQRVSSEDNEGYKYQSYRRKSLKPQMPVSPSQIPVNTSSIARKERRLHRTSSTEDVTESARKVLALVQQRRNNNAANKSSVLQQLPSTYPRRRDLYYH